MTSLEGSEPIFSTVNCNIKVSTKNKSLLRNKESDKRLSDVH